jgi:hypothetical protein
METRRGISATVAVVIAVLGTSVYFIQGDSINMLLDDIVPSGSQESSAQQQSLQTPAEVQETQDDEEQAGAVSEPIMQQECGALDLASRPLASGEECIAVYNAHAWVNKNTSTAVINERSTTAFVVENTGAKTVTVSSIYLRSVPVPAQDWHFTKDPAVTRPDNLQNELPVDYKETAVLVGGNLAVMELGIMMLEPGQAAIVYLNEAGGLTEKDAGLNIVLQVQTANVQAITPVSVVAAKA